MIFTKNKIILISLLFISYFSEAQTHTTYDLYENVRTGKLGNGMSYYILHNEEPKQRASFFFVQNVGAILENDKQNGLAHFLEHMAFNGLENFPGKKMLNYLEGNGVRFGSEINAYTSLDKTVYNISDVPSNRKALLDSCLLVLHDWSGGLLLENDEIDAERGVISEEWRTRRNSDFRINAQTRKVIYANSKYANRDVIGDLDLINNFKYKELKDFYKTWYRPDLQAVVVVGDIDVDYMEEKIKSMFSSIHIEEKVKERVYYSIPENKSTLFCIAKDKEAKYISMSLYFKKKKYVLEKQMQSFYINMLSYRFAEILQKPESNSLALQSGFANLTSLDKAYYMLAVPKQGKCLESFSELYTEIERVKQYGFTEDEFEKTKKSFLKEYDEYLVHANEISNDSWAEALGEFFLNGDPVMSPEEESKLAKEIINSIKLQELNIWCKDNESENNRILTITGPDDANIEYPSKNDILSVMHDVKQTKIKAYKSKEIASEIFTDKLGDVKVISQANVDGIPNANIYVLENGAKLIILPTDYSKDEILMSAYSWGGISLVETDEIPSASVATSVATSSGIANFNAIELQKILRGKTINLSPYISTNTEGLSGFSSIDDLETMLQILYLNFENPRFDDEALQVSMNQWNSSLKYKDKDNASAMSDTINMLSSNYNKRTLLFNRDFVDAVDINSIKKIYQERINNAGDFTFVFVGNLKSEKLVSLIKKYIGNISSTDKREHFVDHNIHAKSKYVKSCFEREMEVPKTSIYLNISGAYKNTLKTRLITNFISQLLSKRYMEIIREKEGASYDIGVSASLNQFPKEKYNLSISFDCKPDKEEKLMSIVWQEIDNIQNKNANIADLNEIKKASIKSRYERIENNDFWLSSIVNVMLTEKSFVETQKYEDLINSISLKDIKKQAKKMFSKKNTLEVIMKAKK